jgi:hypothetical protein
LLSPVASAWWQECIWTLTTLRGTYCNSLMNYKHYEVGSSFVFL